MTLSDPCLDHPPPAAAPPSDLLRLDRILASMADAILVVAPSGQVLFANPAARALFGDRDDIGSPAWHRTYLRFRPDGVTPYPADETPMARAARGECFDHLEMVCQRPGAPQPRRLVASSRVIRDDAGRHVESVLVYRDVTELARKDAAIARYAEILDKTMASMADMVVVVDERGRVVYLNAAARATLGDRVTAGSDNWKQALTVFAADGITPIPLERWSLSRALSGENVDNEEYLVRPPAAPDQLIPLVCSARPIRDEAGNPQGAVVVSRDFSEIRETERQLRQSQKMEAIGQLTGGIAHDLNNILTVITGTIDILINGVSDRPNLATIARMIDAAATRAATLTRQLLAFARRQPLYPRDTDVNALVIDAARLLRPLLGAQIKIESMLADDLWQAMIDQTQLSTALLNLALNARDAMPDGGTLTFETRNVVFDQAYATSAADARPGDYVMIAVGDTGSGIPAAIRDKVFEPFFTTKEVGKGTGLGLSIVYGFIKQSRGHVDIRSEEGRGTSVVLYLPRGHSEAGTAVDEAKVVEPQGGSETVLVVEDDHLVRKYVVAQLESLGYATLAASTGTEALALMDQGVQFDLLFTDLIMPSGLSGQELAARVRQRRPTSRILYTSGYAETALPRGEPLGPGMSVLSKPYRKRELAQRLRQALGDPPPAG